MLSGTQTVRDDVSTAGCRASTGLDKARSVATLEFVPCLGNACHEGWRSSDVGVLIDDGVEQ